MTKPIAPEEVIGLKKTIIPNFVIESFNELIAKNFLNNQSHIKQKDVVALIIQKYQSSITEGQINHETIRQRIFHEKWLDVENIYEAEGWKVNYDRPSYNETYEASFTFTAKRK